ncbi:unnamed protein product, partial [Nesidiocoris tenuis]
MRRQGVPANFAARLLIPKGPRQPSLIGLLKEVGDAEEEKPLQEEQEAILAFPSDITFDCFSSHLEHNGE